MKTHKWKYTGHDPHKNESDYECTACGAWGSTATYNDESWLPKGPCPKVKP